MVKLFDENVNEVELMVKEELGMKKILEKLKNKKVFALYLVGVLLLSTGLSYAFFTATSSTTGNGSISSVDTATVKSEGLAGDGNISFSEVDIYPGGVHAFDMLLPHKKISKQAIAAFEENFVYAAAHYTAPQPEMLETVAAV